ncbi:MAG: hypothetical protein OXH76_10920 [Boseongicola sp.]|nr:hypothetical protein [Boseongicola sp.]
MDKVGYRLWLKFRTSMRLDSEETVLSAMVGGRQVTIEAEGGRQPLKDATWLVAGCRGFETQESAREFGEEFRRAVHLTGLCTLVGADAGDPGEDRRMSWTNPDAFHPDFRRKHPEVRFGPDVHGISILPDDDKTVFAKPPSMEAVVRSNAGNFLESLEQALPDDDLRTRGSSSIRRAVRILSLAEMNQDPIAKAVLAISTVEGLAADPPWTDAQAKLIERAASWLEDDCGDSQDAWQVIEAIRRMRKESIRQRVRKLLEANDLSSLRPAWDSLYGRRSALFHGRSDGGDESVGDRLEQEGLHRLGHDAVILCGKIVLSMAKRNGMPVPECAKANFGIE